MPEPEPLQPRAGGPPEPVDTVPRVRRGGTYREFELRERETAPASEQSAALRQMLRESYPLPSDTYITEALPVLLARLSLPPADTQ